MCTEKSREKGFVLYEKSKTEVTASIKKKINAQTCTVRILFIMTGLSSVQY